jgi:hypothetical protein
MNLAEQTHVPSDLITAPICVRTLGKFENSAVRRAATRPIRRYVTETLCSLSEGGSAPARTRKALGSGATQLESVLIHRR